MNTIQLDECASSKRLIASCVQEGKIFPQQFPKLLAGKSIEDPEMLQWWRALGIMLLTTDTRMVSAHTRFFPNSHKGVVVLAPAGPPLDTPRIQSLLASFKQALPQWESLPLDNAVLEIWADCPTHNVSVGRVKDGEILWYEDFSYGDPDWPTPFLRALSRASNS